jgi:hypothetical protein
VRLVLLLVAEIFFERLEPRTGYITSQELNIAIGLAHSDKQWNTIYNMVKRYNCKTMSEYLIISNFLNPGRL